MKKTLQTKKTKQKVNCLKEGYSVLTTTRMNWICCLHYGTKQSKPQNLKS